MAATDGITLAGPEKPGSAQLFTIQAIPLAMICALVLCWPMMVSGTVYAFADSPSYFRGGEKIWATFLKLLAQVVGTSIEQGAGGARGDPDLLLINQHGASVTGRSFTYSAYAHVLTSTIGMFGMAYVQALLIVIATFALIPDVALKNRAAAMLGAAYMIFLTTMPWHAIDLMPDVWGATILIFGIILVRDFDNFGPLQKISLTLLAAFAGSTHYGNAPLVFGIVLWVFLIRAFQRRLTKASLVAGFAAMAFSPAANLTASSAVLDAPSVTPKRMPIVLSRSLSDGPALWYLQDVCPKGAKYAICEAFGDRLRGDTLWFLWSDSGLKSLDPEMVDRIRDEEFLIIRKAFLAYPLQQSASLLSNGVRQVFRVGTGEVWPVKDFGPDFTVSFYGDGEWPTRLVKGFDRVAATATWVGAVALGAMLISGMLRRRQIEQVAMLAIGLLGNAFIFGGLSSPIERYQSRLAWVIPLLALVLIAEVTARRRAEQA